MKTKFIPIFTRLINDLHMCHVMRKPDYGIFKQQKRRSAYASAQSDQHLCCSLPRQYNTSTCYIQNFKTLPSFCGCTGRFESTLVANPEDRFSRDEVQSVSETFFNL